MKTLAREARTYEVTESWLIESVRVSLLTPTPRLTWYSLRFDLDYLHLFSGLRWPHTFPHPEANHYYLSSCCSGRYVVGRESRPESPPLRCEVCNGEWGNDAVRPVWIAARSDGTRMSQEQVQAMLEDCVHHDASRNVLTTSILASQLCGVVGKVQEQALRFCRTDGSDLVESEIAGLCAALARLEAGKGDRG